MARMWSLLVSVAIAYAAIVALVFFFQSHLVYFPNVGREIGVTPQAYGLAFDAVTIATEDGEKLGAWWVPAPQPRGAALVFHGNAGNISHRLDYLQMFHRLGYATLIIDYRGYGTSTGSPSEEGTYRDAEAAWRWLVEGRGVKAGDIVLMGESLGGAVAAWLAARVPARAVVLASTFTSVPDLGAQVYPFLPVRLVSRFSYDNRAAVKAIRSPLLIAHSREDEARPVRGRQRAQAVPGDEWRPQRRLPVRAAGMGGAAQGISRPRGAEVRSFTAKTPGRQGGMLQTPIRLDRWP
jgi:fermentation-respiration switch protein FrsA (DUF1100 family)